MALFGTTARVRRTATISKRPNLGVEALESRLTPYALSGNAWIRPDLITISFVPDGTILGTNASGGNITSNLQASFNAKFGSAATWQNQILKAAQQWAAQTNINFKVVSDNGVEIGTGDYQQGDANFGDIRIGGYNFGTTTLAQAYMPPPDNGDSFAGDFQFNTGQTWNVGSTYDLYTVAMHEFGHALGLYHGSSGAAMYGSYSSVLTSLQPDDINGIRAVTSWSVNGFSSPGYGGARAHDSYDSAAANGSFTTASTITSTISTTTKTALLSSLDITSTSDVDYYKFVVPTGLGGTLNVKVQSSGLSLLAPMMTLYNGSQSQMATQSASSTDYDGTTLSFTANVTAGQTYYLKVAGLNTTAFGTGRYALALGFAGVAAPTATSPDTQTANDPNAMGGGGQAVGLGPEFRVNTFTTDSQGTGAAATRAVAMDAAGNFVVAWHSFGQDGSGYGVYAQRFNAAGVAQGSEFRVNTTTADWQSNPAVGMDGTGNFVIVWESSNQDGQYTGIYAQRYNAAGVKQGGEFRINSTTSGAQRAPSVAVNATGSFVIAWESTHNTDGDIYVQRYNASGVAQGGETRVNTHTTQHQNWPAVAIDGNGNFVVAWTSNQQDGSGNGIYGQRFNASGVKQGSEFRVNTITAGEQAWPGVALATDGSFVVAWQGDSPDGSGQDIFSQRYSASGTPLGNEFRVNAITENNQRHPNVAMNSGGNFFITWEDTDMVEWESDISGQQFTPSGVPQGSQFRINTTTEGDQVAMSMALNMNGDAVVVWSGTGTGDNSGVFAQRFMVSNGGMNPMQAAEPHAFNPEGCQDHEHTHDHTSDEGDDCAWETAVSLPTPSDDLNALIGLLTRRRDEAAPRRGQDPISQRPNEDTPQEPHVASTGRRIEAPLRTVARRTGGSTSPITDPIARGI